MELIQWNIFLIQWLDYLWDGLFLCSSIAFPHVYFSLPILATLSCAIPQNCQAREAEAGRCFPRAPSGRGKPAKSPALPVLRTSVQQWLKSWISNGFGHFKPHTKAGILSFEHFDVCLDVSEHKQQRKKIQEQGASSVFEWWQFARLGKSARALMGFGEVKSSL